MRGKIHFQSEEGQFLFTPATESFSERLIHTNWKLFHVE